MLNVLWCFLFHLRSSWVIHFPVGVTEVKLSWLDNSLPAPMILLCLMSKQQSIYIFNKILKLTINYFEDFEWQIDHHQSQAMNLSTEAKIIKICSSVPFLGCVIDTFFQLFITSSTSTTSTTTTDVETSANAAAQKHFRQLQHIRTTWLSSVSWSPSRHLVSTS